MDFSKLLGAFGLATSIAGTLTSSYGSFKQSKADKKAAQWQARVSENNAQLTEWEAQDALERGADTEQRHRLKVAALKGTQRATIASRGLALSEGSALRILTDTDFMGELDARVIRANANREAWGKRTQAQQYRDDASMQKYAADSESPLLAGGTSLLAGAGSVASKWYAYKSGASGWAVGEAG